jgi:hypothetical protein
LVLTPLNGTTIYLILLVVLPAVGFVAGMQSGRFTIVKVFRDMNKATKKNNPILLLIGRDRVIRPVVMEAGSTGLWHHPYLEVIPNQKDVYTFAGLTTAAIGTADTVSNISPELPKLVEALIDQKSKGKLDKMEGFLGRKIVNDDELGRAIQELGQRRDTLLSRKDDLRKIQSHSSIDDLIKEKNLSEEEAAKYREEMSKIIKDNGASLDKELAEIEEAGKIEMREDGWHLFKKIITDKHWAIDKKKNPVGRVQYSLSRITTVSFDSIWALVPNLNMVHVRTIVDNAIKKKKLEGEFDEAKGFKWLVIGLVAMMAMIGAGVMVYLILKG